MNPNVRKQLTETKFIRFQHFFQKKWNCFRTGSWFPTPAQCVRVSSSTLLQASCDLFLCIPAVGPCRTKQLLIVMHTSAHIHAQHPDTRSPIPLSVSESVSGSWPLCLSCSLFSLLLLFDRREGHPYHFGYCWGIYWGGGSWAAVGLATREGGFTVAQAEMSFKSLKDLGVSAERIGTFCKRWMNRAQRSVSLLFTSDLFFYRLLLFNL